MRQIALSGCSLIEDAHKKYCPLCCGTSWWTVYQAQGFAIDAVLLQKGKFVSTLCDCMQGAPHCIENWCREIGVSVDVDKTTMVLRITERFGVFIILNFLVLNLGWRILDWKVHLENWMRKACIAYSQCRRAKRKTWGLLLKVVAWLYTLVVRPILSYALLVWCKRVELKNAQKWIFHLQRMTMNYFWYAFNTNVCFRGYIYSATLAFVHKTRSQAGS
jgi:hypothetical protein